MRNMPQQIASRGDRAPEETAEILALLDAYALVIAEQARNKTPLSLEAFLRDAGDDFEADGDLWVSAWPEIGPLLRDELVRRVRAALSH